MAFVIDTLTQADGETDAAFNTRVLTYINDQAFYYTSANGPWPIPQTQPGQGAYIGYPPTEPTSDTTTWNYLYNGGAGQAMRVVTFVYDNIYYYKYLGITPPLPPPSPLPTAGDIAIFGPSGIIVDSGFRIISGTATLDFPNTLAGAKADLTITVTGAALGDSVCIGAPTASVSSADNVSYWGWVSAENTVTVRFNNNNLVAAVNPASGIFKATIFKG